jgi:hypothetical protein
MYSKDYSINTHNQVNIWVLATPTVVIFRWNRNWETGYDQDKLHMCHPVTQELHKSKYILGKQAPLPKHAPYLRIYQLLVLRLHFHPVLHV